MRVRLRYDVDMTVIPGARALSGRWSQRLSPPPPDFPVTSVRGKHHVAV